MRVHRPSAVLLALLLLAAPAGTAAQETYPAANVDSLAAPEGAAYARVRHLEGRVSLFADSGLLDDEVDINTPVGPGDVLETEAGSRLELQLADGSLVRLDESSRLSILALADGQIRYENRTLLSLDAGAVAVELSSFDPDDKVFRIDTDAATVFLLEDGSYRVDAGAGGGTQVRSRAGVAEVLAADQSTLVRSGESTFVAPGYAADAPRVASTRGGDAFDRYLEQRRLAYLDQVRGAGRSYAAYDEDIPVVVRPYMVELDAYGSWRHHPGYGVIWVPVVRTGWRPYYHGRWVYRPFGWTWVSYDPWGYAPYHYGRWEYLPGYGWSWLPGSVYAPAWVSWGYYGGYVGWCPLGWYDYPSGWSLSISFGRFHYPYWSFVSYHHFHTRHVERVIIKERIIERDVVYASRPPRLNMDDVRARRERAVFERSRDEATRNGALARDLGARRPEERSFRERERTVLAAARGRDNTAPSRPAFARDQVSGRGEPRAPGRDGAVERSVRPGAVERPSRPTSPTISRSAPRSQAEPGRTPGGGSTIRRTAEPPVDRGRAPAGEAPGRRQEIRRDLEPRGGPARSAAPVEGRGRPEVSRSREEPGRRPPTDTRQVPTPEPRRILSDTRTRRSTPPPRTEGAQAPARRPESPPPGRNEPRVERTPPRDRGQDSPPPRRDEGRSQPRRDEDRRPQAGTVRGSSPAPSQRPSVSRSPSLPGRSAPPSRVDRRPAPSRPSPPRVESRQAPSRPSPQPRVDRRPAPSRPSPPRVESRQAPSRPSPPRVESRQAPQRPSSGARSRPAPRTDRGAKAGPGRSGGGRDSSRGGRGRRD